MACDRNAVIREIEEHLRAESSGDLSAILDGMTEDCYNLVMCDPEPMYAGPAAVARRYQALWAALPDLNVRLRRVVAIDGDLAVSEHTLSGTHLGPLFGVPASGRTVQVDTVVVWEMKEGRIRGETVYFDLATVLRQVGAADLPLPRPRYPVTPARGSSRARGTGPAPSSAPQQRPARRETAR